MKNDETRHRKAKIELQAIWRGQMNYLYAILSFNISALVDDGMQASTTERVKDRETGL